MKTFTSKWLKPRQGSGPDSHMCAASAQQRIEDGVWGVAVVAEAAQVQATPEAGAAFFKLPTIPAADVSPPPAMFIFIY